MMKDWSAIEVMIFESEVKDSIVADAAYFNTRPNYKDLEEEVDFNEFCDSFCEKF